MMIIDNRLHMNESEWTEFKNLTKAPHKPRTAKEFDLFVDLAVENHRIENTSGIGEVFAQGILPLKFGPNGEINFPFDPRGDEQRKKTGVWNPSADQSLDEPADYKSGLTRVV